MDGKKVSLVTPNKEFAHWMEQVHRDGMVKRFVGGNGEELSGKTFKHPVTVTPSSSVLGIDDNGEVTVIGSRFRQSVIRVDNVVLAAVEENDELYDQYRQAGLLGTRIGDARKVRILRGAATDGAERGLTIDKDLRYNANAELVACLPTELQV